MLCKQRSKLGVTALTAIQLIAGLANPGKEYADTRHNAGAWFVDAILESTHTNLHPEKKYHGLYGTAELEQQSCHLLIPTTFMNLSGQAVRACLHYHKIPTNALLVAHDDIDLPVGTIKLKLDGGDGGHNGLKDIIAHLNTKHFYRLRIGIGRPTSKSKDVVDYVLEKPSKTERKEIDFAIHQAIEILPLLFQGHLSQAMQQLHTEK
jgi:PTH1 family peptidyl-tRNA hydrolase